MSILTQTTSSQVLVTLPSTSDKVVISTTDAGARESIRSTLTAIDTNIVPKSNNTYDIGTSVARFDHAYFSANGISIGDASIVYDGTQVQITPSLSLSLQSLNDVSSGDVTNNYVLIYNSSNSSFEFGLIGPDNLDITDQYVLDKILNVDGSGSTLDADKLDGLDSTYYLDAENLEFSANVNLIAADVTVGSSLELFSKTIATTLAGTIVVDQFNINTLRSSHYTVTLSNDDSTSFYTSDIIIIHNGTQSNITIYGEVAVGAEDIAPTYDSDIVGGNARLILTTTSDNQTIHLVRIGTFT